MKTKLKTLFILLFFIVSSDAKDNLSLGNEVKEYDKIFERIAEKRVGTDTAKIDKLTNPFIVISDRENSNESDGNTTILEPVYILEATMNQKAKINGIWYTIKETINNWKITQINRNSVILQNEIEKKEIFIRTKDESNIKIFSK